MDQVKVKFEDGSELTIMVTGHHAEMAYYNFLASPVGRLNQELTEQRGYCCERLKQDLGDRKLYPMLVFLSSVELESGRVRAGWYPGATKAGYYQVYRLVLSPSDNEEEEKVVFMPLRFCPYCGIQLWKGE